jgi:hypothetical protein
MPKLSQERIAELTEMMLELFDAADLDDDQADTVCEIVLTSCGSIRDWMSSRFARPSARRF